MLAAVFMCYTVPASDGQIEIETISMPTGDLAKIPLSRPMERLSSQDVDDITVRMAEYSPGTKKLLRNNAPHFYYYENLDPVSKEIYDVLYGICEDPVSEGNIGVMMTDMDPDSEKYYYLFNKAVYALKYDHPELFWLYSMEEVNIGYGSEAILQNGFYLVYFQMAKPFYNFESQMTGFNNAVDVFLSDIDQSGSEYNTILQIHDKLSELVTYDDLVAEGITPAMFGLDLAHTAFGALVRDSAGNPNYAVCDGYSLAFEYLLQQCGINAVFMGGYGGASEETAGGHAWNEIQMNGDWYEVDVTWDDHGSLLDHIPPEREDYDLYAEALSDIEYRNKIDHYMFLISTDSIRNFVPGDKYLFTSRQGYQYSLVNNSVHIRFNEAEKDLWGIDPDCELFAAVPAGTINY